MTKYQIASLSLLFTAIFILFSGCSKKDDTPQVPVESTQSEPTSAQIPETPSILKNTSNEQTANASTFDQVLEVWSNGQQTEAAELFVGLQWDREDIFASDSVFRISEAEFAKLPNSKRTQIQQEAMKLTKDIKELSKFIVQQAKQNGGDKTQRNALIACGQRISNDDQLLIVQIVGKAVVGYTEKELPLQ